MDISNGKDRGYSNRDSFELYDNEGGDGQYKSTKSTLNMGQAPGSPACATETTQKEKELSREVMDLKAQQGKLVQIIGGLKGAAGQIPMSNTAGDSVDENVKDAHIKHLQRQVTILQANLYKAEGWTTKASEVMRERDKAIDNCRLTARQLSEALEENETLRRQLQHLNASHMELQQQLRQMSQHQSQPVKPINWDISKLSTDMNSNSGEVSSTSANVQSSVLSSPACSQELEYLHRVVDMLKSTVLEQRDYLVRIKTPQLNGQMGVSLGYSDQGSGEVQGKMNMSKSASAASDVELQQLVFQPYQRDERFPGQVDSQVQGVPVRDAMHNGLRASENRDVNSCLAFPNNFTGQSTFNGARDRAGGPSGTALTMDQMLQLKSSERDQSYSNASRADFRQTTSPLRVANESTSPNINISELQSNVPTNSAVRKISQSEILARRPQLGQQMSQSQHGSKSEVLARNQARPSSEGRVLPDWMTQSTSGYGLPLNPVNKGSNETAHFQKPTATVPSDTCGTSSSAQPRNAASGQPSRAPQDQAIFRPPLLLTDNASSIRLINSDLTGGSRITLGTGIPTSAPQPRPHHPALETGTGVQGNSPLVTHAGRERPSSTSGPRYESEVDPSHSDRICPVCNRDYSHISMEGFQTHVFECFDDENAPETMKAQDCVGRSCPMCNAKFSQDMSQQEFEAHVHSHFGEEHFEVIQP